MYIKALENTTLLFLSSALQIVMDEVFHCCFVLFCFVLFVCFFTQSFFFLASLVVINPQLFTITNPHNLVSSIFPALLQCLQCQRVFDKAQAIEQPSDIPEPLRTNSSYRGRSISQLMCPFCHSQILQQSMPRYVKHLEGNLIVVFSFFRLDKMHSFSHCMR